MKDIIFANGVEYTRDEYKEKYKKGEMTKNSSVKAYEVYTKEDFEKIGLPALSETIVRYIEHEGKRYRLYDKCSKFMEVNSISPWFGTVAVIINDNSDIGVLNLNNGKIDFLGKELPTKEGPYYKVINEDFYISSPSLFSECIVARGGIEIDSIGGTYNPTIGGVERCEGYGVVNLKSVGKISYEQMYKKLDFVKLQLQLNDAIAKMVELGCDEKLINKIVEKKLNEINSKSVSQTKKI